MAEPNVYRDANGNVYQAAYDAETGRWETGYRDAAGVWHEVPPNQMPLEAFSDKQLADLQFSKDAGLSPDQRAAVDAELHERAVASGQIHTFTDEAGNRYEASRDAETGQWETGYRDAAGVWHEVPPNQMPLEAFDDEQLADLKNSDTGGLSPDQRAAVDAELHERAVASGETHTFTDEAGNRYEASRDAETGQWETGYRDAAGVWHEVPPNQMPLEAFDDEQLADLKNSDTAGLSPDQREAVDTAIIQRASQQAEQVGESNGAAPLELTEQEAASLRAEQLGEGQLALHPEPGQPGEDTRALQDLPMFDGNGAQVDPAPAASPANTGPLQDFFDTTDAAIVAPVSAASGGTALQDVFDTSEAVIVDPASSAGSAGGVVQDVFDTSTAVIREPVAAGADAAPPDDFTDFSFQQDVAEGATYDSQPDELDTDSAQTSADADAYASTSEDQGLDDVFGPG
jgi:hypothetical protein